MTWKVSLGEVVLSEEDIAAYLDRLRSGWLTMGPSTQKLEREFAVYTSGSHCYAVSSGAAALHLACLAAGVRPGDEVLVPAVSFVATANAVRSVGARPVFCDAVAPDDPAIDPEAIERATTPSTKAVVVTHPFGYPASSLGSVSRYCEQRGLRLIEDAADAVGATIGGRHVGTIGDLGCFSLRATSRLGVGEGGLVLARDDALAERIRLLRSHAMTSTTWDRHRGHAVTYDVVDIGFNYRLDEPRAALASSRLARLDGDLQKRRERLEAYGRRIRSVSGVQPAWTDAGPVRPSPAAAVVLFDDGRARDRARAALSDEGVQTAVLPLVTWLTAYRGCDAPGGLRHAELFARRHCALPLSEGMTGHDLDRIVRCLSDRTTTA